MIKRTTTPSRVVDSVEFTADKADKVLAHALSNGATEVKIFIDQVPNEPAASDTYRVTRTARSGRTRI